MGKSVPVWTCPCEFMGTKTELYKHKKECEILKRSLERDEKFKKNIGLINDVF